MTDAIPTVPDTRQIHSIAEMKAWDFWSSTPIDVELITPTACALRDAEPGIPFIGPMRRPS